VKNLNKTLYLCAAVLGIALIAAHVVFLHFLYRRSLMPLWFVSGIAALVVIKHLGFLGSAFEFVRKRRGARTKPPG